MVSRPGVTYGGAETCLRRVAGRGVAMAGTAWGRANKGHSVYCRGEREREIRMEPERATGLEAQPGEDERRVR